MFSKEILFLLLTSVAFITSSKEPDGLNFNNSNFACKDNKKSLFQDVYFDGNNFDSERYRKLMAGFRGKLSPHLDPISLLGIEARNDAERHHYAEL